MTEVIKREDIKVGDRVRRVYEFKVTDVKYGIICSEHNSYSSPYDESRNVTYELVSRPLPKPVLGQHYQFKAPSGKLTNSVYVYARGDRLLNLTSENYFLAPLKVAELDNWENFVPITQQEAQSLLSGNVQVTEQAEPLKDWFNSFLRF